MKKILLHLIPALCISSIGFSQDTLVLNNGDTLTGNVLEQNTDFIQFESDIVGVLSLSTQDISEIRIQTEELPDEATPPAPQVAAPEPAPKPKKISQWSGQTGLAIAMRETTQSNTTGIYSNEKYATYRIYGHLNWKGEKNNLNWNWNYRYSEDESRVRDDYLNLTQKYNHNLKYGYYAEAKTVYQRDQNRQIENEYLQTAEIGKKWFQTPKFEFSTSAGGGYHKYDRAFLGATTSTGEPKFIFDESVRWQMINSLALFQKYTHLGDFDKYHFIFSSGLENRLIQDLFLRFEYRIDRDTDITYNDKGYSDKVLLTSLLYKF